MFISAHVSYQIEFSMHTYLLVNSTPTRGSQSKVIEVALRRIFIDIPRMRGILFLIGLCLATSSCSASISGPFILWGHSKVSGLQSPALVDSNSRELPLTQLFEEARAIVVFVRNSSSRLEGTKYPRFQNLVKSGAWTYLPQRSLAVEPFGLNSNVQVRVFYHENGKKWIQKSI